MANQLATSTIVARESLMILKGMLSFSARVNRDYETEFTSNMQRGYAPGDTIQIKRPPKFLYRAGRVANPQATVETTLPLTLSQGGVDLGYTSIIRTLSLTQLQKKIEAAIAPVVTEIDRQGLDLARTAVYNTLNVTGGFPGTQLAATQVMADCNERLDFMLAPVKDNRRSFIVGPALNGSMVSGFAGLFNQSEKISGQYTSGYMKDSFGLRPGMDQQVSVHTNGAGTASNVNGANQTGATITVQATGAGTITRGTTITLPGVFIINDQTKVATTVLANFVITADVAVGATSLPISPAIVTSGAFQNVSGSPTTGAAFVIQGAASTAYVLNTAFHEDAFTLAMVPMWSPPGGKGVISVKQVTDDGFTLKVTEFYDGMNDNSIIRIDVLFGWAATYPQLATRYYTTR